MTWPEILYALSFSLGAALVVFITFRKPKRELCDRCFLRVLHAKPGTTFSLCYQCSNAGRDRWKKEES